MRQVRTVGRKEKGAEGLERGELVVRSWCGGGVGMDVADYSSTGGGCDVVLVPGVGSERLECL